MSNATGWDLLVEFELDSETLRYSISGVSTSDGYYDGRVISVSDISKDLIPGGGVSPVQSCYISIADTDGVLRKKAASTYFTRRYVRVKLLDLATGVATQIFGGRIESAPEFSYDEARFEVRDDSYDALEEPISLRTTTDIFSNLPAETPSRLIPIVLGTVDSSSFGSIGHIPAYLVDPKVGVSAYRYVAAQHPLKSVLRVCRNGVEVPTSEYTVTYADVTTGIGTVRMTFIDFTKDPRDAEEETIITYDAQGLTDDNTETGTLVTNPATALQKFLALRSKVLSSEFDSTLLSQTETDYNDESITIGMAVTEDDTWLDVVERICESYNLCFFRTGDGYYGVVFDKAATSSSSVTNTITDANDIVEGSFSIAGRSYLRVDRPVSTLEINYAPDYARGSYAATHEETDSTEQTALGKDVKELVELEVRTANIAGKLAQAKIFQRRSSRNYVQFSCQPKTYELGDFFLLTHFAGISSDGLGFDEEKFRTFGITVSAGESSGVEYQIRAIDAAGLTITNPGVVEPGRQTVVPPSRIVSLMSDVVWTPTDTKVTWAGPTGGSFSVKIVRPLTTDTYTVTSGSSPDLSVGVPLYVYFAPEISTTVLQTSTSIDDALGDRKYLMAIAQRATVAGGIALVDNKVGFVTVGSRVVPGGIGGDQLYDNISYTGTLVLRDGGGTEKAGMTASGTGDSNIRIWAGNTFANRASAPFRVTQSGLLSATGATISGTITASSGTIGGWSIGSTSLSGGNATLSSTGYLSLGTGNNIARLDANDATYRLWIGNATAASAPFRVTKGGTATMVGATFRSATSGARIEIDTSGLRAYDSGGNKLAEIPTSGGNEGMLVLTASDTTPGKIRFGSSAQIFAEASGPGLFIDPTVDDLQGIYIGETSLRWRDLFLNSSSALRARVYVSSTRYAGLVADYLYPTMVASELVANYSNTSRVAVQARAMGSSGDAVWIIVNGTTFEFLESRFGPSVDGSVDLGNSLCFWKYIYLYANYSINAISKGDIYIRPYVSNGGYLYLGNSTYFWNYIYLYANYSINAISKGTVTIRPNTSGNGTLYLGSDSYKWDYIYLYANTSINAISKGTVTIRPYTSGNGTLYLGSDSYKWDYIELNAYTSFGMVAKYSSSRYAGFNASSGGVDSTIFSYYDATYYANIVAHAESTFSSITFSSNRIGFFGASAAAKQTVSGSRGGNAALASLLTALANYGLITNSTT